MPFLVLKLRPGEMVEIGNEITIVVKEVKPYSTRLIINAPRDVLVSRVSSEGQSIRRGKPLLVVDGSNPSPASDSQLNGPALKDEGSDPKQSPSLPSTVSQR